jgi:ribose 5-phosphate isomerase B
MLYITVDHAGFKLKEALKMKLDSYKIVYIDLVPSLNQGDDYPLSAKLLADKLKQHPESFGLAICGTGQGICMALNRYSWIRAVTVYNSEMATLTRKHNKANVICLAGRSMTPETAIDLILLFLNTPFEVEQRHLRRLGQFGL